MNPRFLISALLLLTCLSARAAIYSIKRSPVLDFLYSYKGSIADIGFFPYYYDDAFMLRAPNTNLPLPIKFFKNDQGLFLLNNGSGYVFKASRQTKDSILFQRIDSTIYYGYNLSSLKFCYKNIFYSLGGYGFWRYNGYLLQFSPGNDWQPVEQINYEVRGLNYPYFFNPTEGKIFVLSSSFTDDITKEQVIGNEIHELDINKSKFKKLGKLNEHYLEQFSSRAGLTHPMLINFPFLQGSLLRLSNELHLVSFASNKVYRLTNETKLNFLKNNFLNTPNKGFVFCLGDKMYFNNKSQGPLLSVQFSIKDFELLPYPLYHITSIWDGIATEKWMLCVILFCLAGMTSLWFRQRFLIKKLTTCNSNLSINSSENDKKSNDPIPFSSFEVLFIEKLLERDGYFSVEEINEILGVKKKSLEFQKKIRTEAISRINLKFRSIANIQEDLIERMRAPEDKRFMQYRISTTMKQIWKKIKS